VLTALASLCTIAVAQENTIDYWMNKSRDMACLEDDIRHTGYPINILIDNEKKMQKRAEYIKRNLITCGGEA
jgi:hypothetical protein